MFEGLVGEPAFVPKVIGCFVSFHLFIIANCEDGIAQVCAKCFHCLHCIPISFKNHLQIRFGSCQTQLSLTTHSRYLLINKEWTSFSGAHVRWCTHILFPLNKTWLALPMREMAERFSYWLGWSLFWGVCFNSRSKAWAASAAVCGGASDTLCICVFYCHMLTSVSAARSWPVM